MPAVDTTHILKGGVVLNRASAVYIQCRGVDEERALPVVQEPKRFEIVHCLGRATAPFIQNDALRI